MVNKRNPQSNYHALELDDWILTVEYRKGKLWEKIRKKDTDNPIEFEQEEEDLEMYYKDIVIWIYEVMTKQENDIRINFANREISFCYKGYYKDSVSIQTDHEDENGQYDIDYFPIKRKKWLDITDFFYKISMLKHIHDLKKSLKEEENV